MAIPSLGLVPRVAGITPDASVRNDIFVDRADGRSAARHGFSVVRRARKGERFRRREPVGDQRLAGPVPHPVMGSHISMGLLPVAPSSRTGAHQLPLGATVRRTFHSELVIV